MVSDDSSPEKAFEEFAGNAARGIAMRNCKYGSIGIILRVIKNGFMFIKLFSLISISLLTCTSTRKMTSNESVQKNSQTAFDKEGHRGCRGLMPENTIHAMTNALGMGITTLEMDVVITKDKKVILSHEPFFNHEITTNA
jgi:hypothetical protein